jgi:hypothetical protein
VQYNNEGQVEEDEMGGICSTRLDGEMKLGGGGGHKVKGSTCKLKNNTEICLK